MERNISLLSCSVSYFCNDEVDEACSVDDKGILEQNGDYNYSINLTQLQ